MSFRIPIASSTEFFKTLFLADLPEAPKSVFFVGDPKQAIYAFRGAELDVYLQARNDIEQMGSQSESAGLRTLETNYRSTPALVTAVNAFSPLTVPQAVFCLPTFAIRISRPVPRPCPW